MLVNKLTTRLLLGQKLLVSYSRLELEPDWSVAYVNRRSVRHTLGLYKDNLTKSISQLNFEAIVTKVKRSLSVRQTQKTVMNK